MIHRHGLQVGVGSTRRHAGTGPWLREVGVGPDGLKVSVSGGGGDVGVATGRLHLVWPWSVETGVGGGGGVDHGVDGVRKGAGGHRDRCAAE